MPHQTRQGRRGGGGGTSFADYVWKPIVLIEMKKRGEDLAKHRQQAFNYWIKLVPNRPQYTVLCNFDQFWIYDFNVDLDEPLDKLPLAQLPDRYGPLAFLFPTNEKPTFENDRVEVTRKAADRLASAFFHMTHVRKVDRDLAQRFILQMLVALFAEDIDLLPKYFVANLLNDIKTPEDSYDLLGSLFEAMNRKDGTPAGRFKGIRYFNGGLFAQPARIALDKDGIELAHIREAAKQNWSKVSPDIFGTLFQHSMDEGERHAYGAHYTAPIDIMKIVRPTIVEPWTQLIDNAKKPKQLADLLERLSLYKVLDPACGSGNFLYIAYRELKRLEIKIRDRLRSEFPDFQATIYHVTARQFFGMDILLFAIELAKVTMMIARKLAIDELHIADEPPLPLDNLDLNFTCGDALFHMGPESNLVMKGPAQNDPFLQIEIKNPAVTKWPECDVIIGNPPFLGSRYLPKERGYAYQRALHALYPDIPKMADYCVYWFRRSHDRLPICTPDRPECGRAGLVGTQNIRNNQSRVGGLDHIVKSGTIIEAVDNQPWSGEANVHVSIANWVKVGPTPPSANPNDAHAAPANPPKGTRSVSAGPSPTRKKGTSPAQAATNSPPQPDPAKLLIPSKKKLWFKIDPKLALFNNKNPNALSVTTTGKRGKIRQDKSYELDLRETPTINSALSDRADSSEATPLRCNTSPQRVFQGQTPCHEGFLVTPREAQEFVSLDTRNAEILHPYLIGRDLLQDGSPSRFAIDFERRDMISASSYKQPFDRLKTIVMPTVVEKAEKEKKATGKESTRWTRMAERWWQFRDQQPGTMAALAQRNRYIACSRVTKRPVFVFLDSRIHPDSALNVFAFEDDYSFGILQSGAHWLWFTTNSSKLTERFRYTSESVFDTFPWPQSPTKKQIDAIADAGRLIRKVRADALQKITGGLRALYRTLELPGKNPLKDAHAQLDAAVLDAYGFSSPIENRKSKIENPPDLLAQLLALNLQVAAAIDEEKPVTAPGIPPTYGNPAPLITADCIQP
ncbi:MAG: DNA methyltransferase [Phycisphaerae bacterium]